MAELPAIEVRVWNRQVGAVAPLARRPGFYEFQYAAEFVRSGLELSPLLMPLDARERYSFASLNQDTYHGLPGLVADALPDKFGNLLIDEYMSRHGMRALDVTTLQRLLYMGKRAMGALEFEPAMRTEDMDEVLVPLQMAQLVEDARRALRGEAAEVAQKIIDVGSSAGGARAKAVIGWNPSTRQIVSGQFDLPDGFEHWLLKFDVGEDHILGTSQGFSRIEYAHYLLAREAGIDMNPCELVEEGGRAHFMTKRFDREGNSKVHALSLCGMAHLDFNVPYVHSYEQYLRTILQLRLGAKAVEQAWLRCVFNVAFKNCDDHTKNLAFLMGRGGAWRLAPAFDMCFAHNPRPDRWTRQHQMLVAGKAEGITRDDLLALGSDFGVNQPRVLLERVLEARAHWPKVAKAAGIPASRIREITAYQPDLGAVGRPPARRKRKARSGASRVR